MEITIKAVDSRQLFSGFVEFPYRLYRNSPYWVPPVRAQFRKIFDRRHNPFFESGEMALFLAFRNGNIVGRIAAIENRAHNAHHHDSAGFFGFFECVDDETVCQALLQQAAGWLKNRGLATMRGPVSPSTNHESGFLATGFNDSPRLMMPYTWPYYLHLMQAAGLTKVKQLWAYKLNGDEVMDNEKIARVANMAQQRNGLQLRQINMKKFREEIGIIADIYNKCWNNNWGFVPISEKAAALMAKDMKLIVEPSLIQIAEVDGKPVGMLVAVYDYNEILKKINGRLFPFGIFHLINAKKKISWVRMMLIGVLPEHRKKGIDALLYYRSSVNARKLGIHLCEGSWTLEDNDDINRIADMMHAEAYKKYNIYEKKI